MNLGLTLVVAADLWEAPDTIEAFFAPLCALDVTDWGGLMVPETLLLYI